MECDDGHALAATSGDLNRGLQIFFKKYNRHNAATELIHSRHKVREDENCLSGKPAFTKPPDLITVFTSSMFNYFSPVHICGQNLS
jgi:hypothetical protein